MKLEDLLDVDNIGKVKKRLKIEDTDRVSKCLDDVMDDKYTEKLISMVHSNEDIVELLDAERISVDNMCRSFFIGFFFVDSPQSFRQVMKNSINTMITVYIQSNYKTDCMDCVSAYSNKNEVFDIDGLVKYTIENIKVYNNFDAILLMFFLGMFVNRAIRSGVFKENGSEYKELTSKMNLN